MKIFVKCSAFALNLPYQVQVKVCDPIPLIQINNLHVFFKFRLLLWSFFNLQMYAVLRTHVKFKPFPILFYLEQLSAVVFGKQEFRDMYIYLRPNAS